MTRFAELQAGHQRLLDRLDQVTDSAAFVTEVRAYIAQVCEEAQWISEPRDRNQLRANLRFWASYVYDQTGTYPQTTMLPLGSQLPADETQTQVLRLRDLKGLIGFGAAALIVLLCLVSLLASRLPAGGGAVSQTEATQQPEQPAATLPTDAPQPTPTRSPNAVFPGTPEPLARPLHINADLLTQGPSPFDPSVWAAQIKLSATGGNGVYIFWVNGQHLPDVNQNQFTIEGQGCTAEHLLIGVTSGGQAISEELVIASPLSNCPQP